MNKANEKQKTLTPARLLCMVVEKLSKGKHCLKFPGFLGLIASLFKILQHADPLLIMTLQTTSVARQQIPNTHQYTNWEAIFSTRSMRLLRGATIELLGEVVSMQSL
jgi:hypothetical protein